MDSIAERIEDSRDLLIDARVMPPYIGHRQRDEFSESARAIDPDP